MVTLPVSLRGLLSLSTVVRFISHISLLPANYIKCFSLMKKHFYLVLTASLLPEPQQIWYMYMLHSIYTIYTLCRQLALPVIFSRPLLQVSTHCPKSSTVHNIIAWMWCVLSDLWKVSSSPPLEDVLDVTKPRCITCKWAYCFMFIFLNILSNSAHTVTNFDKMASWVYAVTM